MLRRLVLLFWASAAPLYAASPEAPLPTPSGLAPAVRFWEDIFDKYRPDQCVFHDRDDLSMIYLVKQVQGDNPYQQAKNVKRYLTAIRDSLKQLAFGGRPRNKFENRVVEMTDPAYRYPAYYRYAMDNVRCQRGVDLGPSLRRSKRYVKMIKKVLAQNGLPTDLAYLPHLESGYDVNAHSKAGARGIWQLMPATARLNGMKASRRLDLRGDPFKATVVASGILRDYFDKTQSWPLAITAYNYGINGTTRAIKIFGTDYMKIRENHRTSIFGFAVKNYYPSFLAVRNIAQGGAIETAPVDEGPVAMESGRKNRKTAL